MSESDIFFENFGGGLIATARDMKPLTYSQRIERLHNWCNDCGKKLRGATICADCLEKILIKED